LEKRSEAIDFPEPGRPSKCMLATINAPVLYSATWNIDFEKSGQT
jgi:hypothetical protein